MTSYSHLPQDSGVAVLSFADSKGQSSGNRKSQLLNALLSAAALGVFLEGCGGGGDPGGSAAGGNASGSSGSGSGSGASGSGAGVAALDNEPASAPASALVLASADLSIIRGSEGVDVISSGDGDNFDLQGLGGNDILTSGDGNDILRGGAGEDQLHGGAGNDILRGGTGNDILYGGAGGDQFFGGEGTDTVSYRFAFVDSDDVGFTVIISTLFNFGKGGDDAQDDTFDSIENLEGSMGHDTLSGDNNPNDIYGLAGNDVLNGVGGKDRLYGGDGKDTLSGGEGDDHLEGGDGDDILLLGQAGKDTILGGAGADTLSGGEGDDILDGGAGADVYIFHAGEGKDIVREEGEAVANILRFVGAEYRFVTVGSGNDVSRQPDGISFQRDGTDLTITEGIKDQQGTYSETYNEVVLEGYYSAQTGEATAYTVQVQYNDAAANLHELSDLMAI